MLLLGYLLFFGPCISYGRSFFPSYTFLKGKYIYIYILEEKPKYIPMPILTGPPSQKLQDKQQTLNEGLSLLFNNH